MPPFQAGTIVRYHPHLSHLSMGTRYHRVIDCCAMPDELVGTPNYVSDLMILERRPDGSFTDVALDYDVPCWMLERVQ